MISALKKTVATGILLAGSMGVAMAADTLKPFVLAYTTAGDIEQVAGDVKEKLGSAGFEIAGSYSPYDGALILAITNDTLKQAAASSEFGGYAAGQRVTLTQVEDEIQVSYTNPIYYGTAYRLKETAGLNQVAAAFRWRKPAIISSHRVNFCGHIEEENRRLGLDALGRLLQGIVQRWPDVQFISADDLVHRIDPAT